MTMPRARQILITGGAGFIGSHLVERHLAAGDRVVVIDDFSTGSPKNLATAGKHPQLQLIESRVSECPDLPSLVAESVLVYHLAAAVGVELVARSPVRTIETNLREMEAILAALKNHPVPLVFTSSSEVYGKSQKDAFDEEDDLLISPPTCGRWAYACSKLMDEFLAMAYAREHGLPVVVCRLFNTVGPRQVGHYGMVLPRFIAAARTGQPLKVFGNGEQSRCFCLVNDTVESLALLGATPAAQGRVFNIGGTEEITILNLARLVIETLGSSSRIELVPYPEGVEDMMRRKPVVEKLRGVIGRVPSTSLAEIIRNTAGL